MAHEPRGWTPLGGQQLFQPPMVPGAGMGAFPSLGLLPSPPSLFLSPQLHGRQMMAPPALESRTGVRGMDSGQPMTGYAIQPGMAIVPAQYRQQQYMNDPTLSPFRQPQQQPFRVNNKRQRPVNSEQSATWRDNQVQEPPRLYQHPQRQQVQQQQQQQQMRNSVLMQQQHNPQRQQQSRQQCPQQQQLRQQTPPPQMQQQQEFQRRQQQQQLQLRRQQQQQQQLQKEEQRQLLLRRQELQRQQKQQEQLHRQHQQLEMDQEQQDRIKAHFGSRIWSNELHQSRAAAAIDAHFQPQAIQTQHFRSFPSLIESEISPQSFGNAGLLQSSIGQQPHQRISQQQQFQPFAPLTYRSIIQQQQKRSPMTMSYDANFEQYGLVFNGNESVTSQVSPHEQVNHSAPQGMQWLTNEATSSPVSFAPPSGAESRLTGSFRIDELLSAASAMDDPLSPSHYYSAKGRASVANQELQTTEIPPLSLLNTAMQSFSTSPTWQNPQANKVNLPNAEIMQRTTIPGVLQASVAINRLQEQEKTPQEEKSGKANSKPRSRLLTKSTPADQPPIPSSPDWVVPGGYFFFGNAHQNQIVDPPLNNRMRIESLLKTTDEPAKHKTKAKPRTKKKQSPPVPPIAGSITTPTTNVGPLPQPVISPANDQPSVADLSKQAPVLAPQSVQQAAQEPAQTEEVNRPPAVNPTVMIFCRRDFMRYQAAKLWKKYEEKKKKRELVSVRTTGKRRRYLSSRNEEVASIAQKPISQSEPSEKIQKADDQELPTPSGSDEAPTPVSDNPEVPTPTDGSPLPIVD